MRIDEIVLLIAVTALLSVLLAACSGPAASESAITGANTATPPTAPAPTYTPAPVPTETPTPLQSEAPTQTSTPQPKAREIIVTRDERDLPEGCTPRDAAQLMMRLLNAFNSGDQEQFIHFFPPAFQWYSDGWRVGADGINIDPGHLFVSRPGNREDLPDYVAERHQQGDRLQLLKASVMEEGLGSALVNFQLVREANDVEPGPGGNKRYVNGRATITCQNQTFSSLGMGIAPPDIQASDLSRMCPEPPAGAPENAAIACSETIFTPEEGE